MKLKRAPHRSTHPGKRVRIVLRDGKVVEGRYGEMHGRHITVKVDGVMQKIPHDTIDQFIVIKGSQEVK